MTPPAAVQTLLEQTRAIWNQKAAGLIYDSYVHNVAVHRALQSSYGRDELVADTVQQLAAFPNTWLRGERVVWEAQMPRHHVSHWATRVAHNSGYSVFGKPTGKRVAYPVATDFLIYEDRVAEVWEVADTLLLAKQLGLTVEEAVTALADGRDAQEHGLGKVQRSHEDGTRATSDNGTEALVLETWHDIWNRRRLDRVAQRYREDYRFIGPSGRRCRTRDDFAAYVLGLLAAFPDANVQLENVTFLSEGETHNVAVRWRLLGTHDGYGYGAPTGRSVNILGITHHRLQGEQFVEERTVFDELALWAQLHPFEREDLGKVEIEADQGVGLGRAEL